MVAYYNIFNVKHFSKNYIFLNTSSISMSLTIEVLNDGFMKKISQKIKMKI